MNSDEIVKALRYCMVLNCEKCPKFYTAKKYPSCMIQLENDAANLIESLTAQLAESQRREKAAVNMLERIKRDLNEPDKVYIHVSDYFGKRGPQDAGEGE